MRPFRPSAIRPLVLLLLAAWVLAWSPAGAGAGAASPAGPGLVVSPDGAEVIDAEAGLAWPRCDEGQRWTGSTCAGEPVLMTRAEAMSLAASRQRAHAVRWRLPRAGELRGLVVRHGGAAGLDPRLFPGAPRGWHWTGSAHVETGEVNPYDYGNIRRGVTSENANRLGFLHGWAVQVGTGQASSSFTTRTRLAVRYVRELPRAAAASAAE